LQKSIYTILLAVAFAPPAWPQASTGTVSGTVRDQSGAVVPAANVTLTNTATNVTSKTITNQVGFYILPGVVPGPYRLTAEATGMQKFEGTLTVQVQQSVVVDPVLRVGQTTTEVQVTDHTPLVTVDNPTLGHVLEQQRIEQLPINGRFIISLMQTVAGMEEETEYDSMSARGFGMRRGSTEFVLDGAATTDRLMGGVFRRPVGLDRIQEFKVENNVSSAKLARPTTVIMSTKSGTNQIHGSAFETHRNNAFGKARRRTDNYSKPPQLIRNEFGVSAGAPTDLETMYRVGATFPSVVQRMQSLGVKFIGYEEAGMPKELFSVRGQTSDHKLDSPTGSEEAPGRWCCAAVTASPISPFHSVPGPPPSARTRRTMPA
jgi:hypothetical protein